MNNRNLAIIGIVIFSVLVVFGMKELLQTTDSVPDIEIINLQEEYDSLNQANPYPLSIIIFSYDSDCCEDTRIFYEEYNNKAKNILHDYQGQLRGLFINTAAVTPGENKLMNQIAFRYGVSELPTLIIRDKTGEPILVEVGMFDNEEIRRFIDRNL